MPNTETLRKRCVDGIATQEATQSIGANADVMLAHRATLVHGVERRDRSNLSGCDAEDVGAQSHSFGRDLGLHTLHKVQHWKQRRPWVGVALHDLLHFGADLGAKCH